MRERTVVGKYRLVEQTSRNCLATNYLAQDLEHDRLVTLGVIHSDLDTRGDFVQSFRRSARIMGQTSSPYVVRLLDFGELDGRRFFVQECVLGRTLRQWLADESPLDISLALRLARQLAQGLADVTPFGLVHGDLRPANVIITAGQVAKIVNYGLADAIDLPRLTLERQLETGYYLAPELCAEPYEKSRRSQGPATPDIRSDVYALGVMMYEMVTGRVPYPGDDLAEVMKAHRSTTIPIARRLRPDVPEGLDRLISDCLGKQPAVRYLPLTLTRSITGIMNNLKAPGRAADASLVGRTVKNYHLLEWLGKGSMSTAYKAYHPELDRYVAVKVLNCSLHGADDIAARFQREARAVARLDHPNILPVYDFGQEGELAIIVTKYFEGGTLKDILGQPLPLEQSARIVSQLAAALDHAHQRGIIHRDVKPDNVLLTRDGTVCLSDFGLAKCIEGRSQITELGHSLGTPDYISPEQARGLAADARSDVYSLGVLLYEMLTGQVPYRAETAMGVVVKHITDEAPGLRQMNPNISETVEAVVLKAMAKQPEDRHRTAGELAADFSLAIEGEPLVSLSPTGSVSPNGFVPGSLGKPKTTEFVELTPAKIEPCGASSPTHAPDQEPLPFPLWVVKAFGIALPMLAALILIGTQVGIIERGGAVVSKDLFRWETPLFGDQLPISAQTPTPTRSIESVHLPPTIPEASRLASPTSDLDGLPLLEGLETIRIIEEQGKSLHGLVFSPDGQLVASGVREQVKVWWVSNGELLCVLKGHAADVTSLAFSPDGRLIAAGGQDGTARLWQVNDSTLYRTLEHRSDVLSVAFSPDGQRLAVGTLDRAVYVWALPDGRLLHTWPHDAAVLSLSFAPNGDSLAAAGAGSGTIRIWHVNDNKLVYALQGHENDVTSVAFSPKGDFLASAGGGDHSVCLWRIDDGSLARVLPHDSGVSSVAFSPDGRALASGLIDNTVSLWRLSDGALLAQLIVGASGPTATSTVRQVEPLGSDFALNAQGYGERGAPRLSAGIDHLLVTVVFSSNGRFLAFGTNDGRIQLWVTPQQ